MSGILLLLVILIWVAIANWLAKIATKKLPMSWWRIPVRVLIVLALLPLPIVDELVARPQFEKLCKDNSMIQINRVTAVGRTVYFVPQPLVEIKGLLFRAILLPHKFVDSATDETVLNYNSLQGVGGVFSRTITEGGVPLTYNGNCGPTENPKDLLDALRITASDRPITNAKGLPK